MFSTTLCLLFSVLVAGYTPVASGHRSRGSLSARQDRLSRRQWSVGQTVDTSSGPVQGRAASRLTDVSEYLGIPYAQPPVGSLRFQRPVRYNGSTVIDRSAFGPSCLASSFTGNAPVDPDLYANITVTPVAREILHIIDESGVNQNEDCLTLNIWTQPQSGESSKAVMVWIHGGGYVTGGSAVPWYNGQYLAGNHDVVGVSFNYRLSIFGFPGNPVSRPNLGLLDQRLAIVWVRDNIAQFAGDPDRITLFGQSAGGSAVDLYSYAWTADPIAQAFIPMSGTATAFGLPTNLTANANWFNTTAAAGCGGAQDDHDKVYECMLSKTGEEIASHIPADTEANSTGGLPFGPVIDEELVYSDYADRTPVAAPVLIGNTNDESGLFRMMAPQISEGVWPSVNDKYFTCPAAARAAASIRHGNPTWRYRYFGVFPNLIISTKPESGAWHTSDVPVLFNNTPTSALPDTSEEEAIGAYFRGAWAAFAKDPYNGLDSYGWPQYSADESTLVRLAYDNQTGPNLGIGNEYDGGCQAISAAATSTISSAIATPTVAGNVGSHWTPRMDVILGLLMLCLLL